MKPMLRAIHIYLDKKRIKKHFSYNSKPYLLIRQFMVENGFEPQGYSGFQSKELLNDNEVEGLIEELKAKFGWLEDCVEEVMLLNLENEIDLKEYFV